MRRVPDYLEGDDASNVTWTGVTWKPPKDLVAGAILVVFCDGAKVEFEDL